MGWHVKSKPKSFFLVKPSGIPDEDLLEVATVSDVPDAPDTAARYPEFRAAFALDAGYKRLIDNSKQSDALNLAMFWARVGTATVSLPAAIAVWNGAIAALQVADLPTDSEVAAWQVLANSNNIPVTFLNAAAASTAGVPTGSIQEA